MIIDAMDLLYSGNVDAFALMTIDRERLAAVSLRVNAPRCCVRMATC